MKTRAFTEQEFKRLGTYIRGTNGTYSKRDLAILRVSLDGLLRVGDVLSLRVRDVWFDDKVKSRFKVKQMKTGTWVDVELSEKTIEGLSSYLASKDYLEPSDYLFQGRKRTGRAISTVQWRRLLKNYVSEVGIDPIDISTHSIRKTIPTLVYQKSGGNVRACQMLLGHKSLQHTENYLSISQQQALDLKRLVNI